jgi:alkanesulfonate monooxygenase SsuD/methylene tetrahydromethanopterin reductase-like flavin-dependent oxidoreductase (luciferase family)
MDYGHELLFGTFITPAAQRPHHAVELAAVADRAGLDLVTFQDHPYQPGFLDTWILLTYVAARTSRVRLSHNVLNLPLRPPVMLARAAASVDLLSGGRFELGSVPGVCGTRSRRWRAAPHPRRGRGGSRGDHDRP